jgi:hypothetical protein
MDSDRFAEPLTFHNQGAGISRPTDIRFTALDRIGSRADSGFVCLLSALTCHGRPSRGGVDWNTTLGVAANYVIGRPSRGGVDWNSIRGARGRAGRRRPSRGGVDWNIIPDAQAFGMFCRPSRGGVDWNKDFYKQTADEIKSPLTRGRGLERE